VRVASQLLKQVVLRQNLDLGVTRGQTLQQLLPKDPLEIGPGLQFGGELKLANWVFEVHQ
jgi:hypothetical protein